MQQIREEVREGPLTVATSRYGEDVYVVSLAGELDRGNVASATSALNAAANADRAILLIDLQELEFIDSSGIALLVSLALAPGAEDSLRIVPSPSSGVSRILEVTGVAEMIRVVDHAPAAMSAG